MIDHESYELEDKIGVGNSTIRQKAQAHTIELVAFLVYFGCQKELSQSASLAFAII